MSTTTTVKPGELLTLLAAMSLPTGALEGDVFPRGYVLTITPDLIELTRDRTGASWLDDLSDAAQISRWGEVRIALGDQSDSVHWHNGGDDASIRLKRQLETEEARQISNVSERREALARVRAEYGVTPTSQTIATYAPDAPNKYAPGRA